VAPKLAEIRARDSLACDVGAIGFVQSAATIAIRATIVKLGDGLDPAAE